MKEGSKVPRKGFIAKREVLPDPIYNNVVVTKLINNIMLDGKKGVAQKIVYDAFNIVAEKTGKDALEAFQEAMDNIMPVLGSKARQCGWCNIPSSYGSSSGKTPNIGSKMAYSLLKRT